MQRPSGRGVATTPERERERERLAIRVRSTSFGYTCRTFVLDLSRRQPWGSSSLDLLPHGELVRAVASAGWRLSWTDLELEVPS
jgi:hypothetical protein